MSDETVVSIYQGKASRAAAQWHSSVFASNCNRCGAPAGTPCVNEITGRHYRCGAHIQRITGHEKGITQ